MTISDTSYGAAGSTPPNPTQPHPIGPEEVRAGIARELHALVNSGVSEAEAVSRAIEITAAKIRNSPVLIERQVDNTRCHACGDLLDGARPEVAVLQPKGGKHLWLHHGECCAEHSRRRAALVDAIMRAAGYGPDQRTREAA